MKVEGSRTVPPWLAGTLAFVVGLAGAALAGSLEVPVVFGNGDVIRARDFNDNFESVAIEISDNDARITELEATIDSIQAGSDPTPRGAVAFFTTPDCPGGWAEYSGLRGRVALGLPSGGTRQTTRGDALSDRGAVTISSVAAHSHGAGSLSASGGGTHTHTTANDGVHNHPLDLENDNGYSENYLRGALNNNGGNSQTTGPYDPTNAGSHSHSIPSSGSHSHSLSGNTASAGSATVEVTMPYIQLLACEKQ